VPVSGLRAHQSEGAELDYFAYVPRSATTASPLVVTGHGIERMALQHAVRFSALADKHGFIVMAPMFSKARIPRYQRLERGPQGDCPITALDLTVDHLQRALGSAAAPLRLFGYSGGAQFASEIPPDQIAGIERDRRFEVVGGPINNSRYIVFNKAHPVLANPLVRRAMSHGIDREAIIAALWAGRTSVPRGLQWEFYGEMFLADIEVPRFDPAEVRRLLREAGYRGQPIPYKCLNNYYTNQTPTAQILLEGWRALGLNVELQMVENWGQITGGPVESRGVHDWSAAAVVPDPSIQMAATWGRTGGPWLANQWRNEAFGALAAELEASMDRPRRKQVWRRMLEIIEREDPGYVVLHRNASFTAKRRDIAWKPSQSFFMDFRAANYAA
jgi:peptide/nickel transport system substrate-binding protein